MLSKQVQDLRATNTHLEKENSELYEQLNTRQDYVSYLPNLYFFSYCIIFVHQQFLFSDDLT